MKFLAAFFSFLVVSAIIVAGFTTYWASTVYRAAGPLQSDVTLTIERGLGTIQIANKLADGNVISDPHIFRIAHRLLHADKTLKAGTYSFSAGQTMEDVFRQIEEGRVVTQSITIAEGLTSWQIVTLLNDKFGDTLREIPEEGALLPETYQYTLDPDTDTASQIVFRMEQSMHKALNALWGSRTEGLPLKSKEDALILASIVEKETAVGAERKKVAGVFINRLRKNMLLQTDPTVIYAITKGKIQTGGKGPLGRRLLRKDLEIDSPYNTYKYAGLPPGPIANPGYASIEAVLNPEAHNYLYFVADGTGGHSFAKTLAEHNRNVAQWRKIRRSDNKK